MSECFLELSSHCCFLLFNRMYMHRYTCISCKSMLTQTCSWVFEMKYKMLVYKMCSIQLTNYMLDFKLSFKCELIVILDEENLCVGRIWYISTGALV